VFNFLGYKRDANEKKHLDIILLQSERPQSRAIPLCMLFYLILRSILGGWKYSVFTNEELKAQRSLPAGPKLYV
jgi:hypothetical protein